MSPVVRVPLLSGFLRAACLPPRWRAQRIPPVLVGALNSPNAPFPSAHAGSVRSRGLRSPSSSFVDSGPCTGDLGRTMAGGHTSGGGLARARARVRRSGWFGSLPSTAGPVGASPSLSPPGCPAACPLPGRGGVPQSCARTGTAAPSGPNDPPLRHAALVTHGPGRRTVTMSTSHRAPAGTPSGHVSTRPGRLVPSPPG